MIPNFIQNYPFNKELDASFEFSYQDNNLLYDDDTTRPNYPTHQDFTPQVVSGNTVYVYTNTFMHLPAMQNVEKIEKIYYILFPNITNPEGTINLQFRYSVDNINFGPWLAINQTNLDSISQVPLLWVHIQLTYTLNEEPTDDVIIPINLININGERYLESIYDVSSIEPGDLKIFTAQDTYKVFKTVDYEVFLKSGNVEDLDLFFRYTQNQGRNWTDWIKLNPENLKRQQYTKVKFVDFQFGFKNNGTVPIKVYDLELIGDFQNVTGDYAEMGRYGLKSQCDPIVTEEPPSECTNCDDNKKNKSKPKCKACSEGYTPWNPTGCTNCRPDNITNINDMGVMQPVVDLHDQLNKYAEARNGWAFDYFYTDPDKKGIDMVLYENQLINVIMKRKMKVLVPDNQFPMDQLSFSGFGLDLIIQFEVHILRSSFKDIFGVEARPRKGDYMYLCNTNLIYEVEQVMQKKDVMNASFYWRVILKKYEQKASRKFAKTQDGNDAKFTTDTLVKYTTLDDLFSDENAADFKENRQEQDTQYNDPINQSQQANDLAEGTHTVVESIDENVSYSDQKVWNSSVEVSDSQYKIPHMSKDKVNVQYHFTDNNVDKTDNRAISMWVKFENTDPSYKYLLFNNYTEDITVTPNIFSGYKLELFNGYLILTIGNEITNTKDEYKIPVQINNNIWYAIYAGMDQVNEDVELAIYRRQREDAYKLTNNQLIKVSGQNFTLSKFRFENDEKLYLGGCDIFRAPNDPKNKDYYYVTNIRLWNEPIIKKKRSAILNQQKVKDTQLIILTDAANDTLNLPFYGNI